MGKVGIPRAKPKAARKYRDKHQIIFLPPPPSTASFLKKFLRFLSPSQPKRNPKERKTGNSSFRFYSRKGIHSPHFWLFFGMFSPFLGYFLRSLLHGHTKGGGGKISLEKYGKRRRIREYFSPSLCRVAGEKRKRRKIALEFARKKGGKKVFLRIF